MPEEVISQHDHNYFKCRWMMIRRPSITDDRCAIKKDLDKDVRIIASVEQVPGGGGCCGYYLETKCWLNVGLAH